MAGFGRGETMSLTVLAITAAVFARYRSHTTGVSRRTSATLAVFVSVAVAAATPYVPNGRHPVWYRSQQ